MDLISLLIFLIIICVVVWAARAILSAFSIGEPISTVVMVLIVLFVLIAVLDRLGHGPGLFIGTHG
jgi:hypothetical protein